MTKLTKPVTRIAQIDYHGRIVEMKISLMPGGLVQVSMKNSRTTYAVPFGSIYDLGAKKQALQNLLDKKKNKEEKVLQKEG